MAIVVLLMSLSAFTGNAVSSAAAQTQSPQLTKLTNSSTGAGLLQDSRFLQTYYSHGPSRGALAAWSTGTGLSSNGGVAYGYASLCASCSAPSAQNMSFPSDSSAIPGCYQFPGIPACPILDDGYIRSFGNLASQTGKVLYTYDTKSGSTSTIVLHAPETPPNQCTGYPGVTVLYCNFGEVYASGNGAVGDAVFLVNSSSGPNLVNQVVRWSGGQWTPLTPDNYQIVTTPCLDNLGNNQTLFFDPTVLVGFVPGTGDQVAYATLNYAFDGVGRTQSGACYLMQHQTGVTIYENGQQSTYFTPPTGDSALGIKPCSVTMCLDQLVAYVGNVLVYSTYSGTAGQSPDSYWVTGSGGTYPLPGAGGYITDGTKLLWVSSDPTTPGNHVVTVYDPGRGVVLSNNTVVHNLYSLGSFPGAVIPFGIDSNVALWSFSNSTGMYLKAFQLTDSIAFANRGVPAVFLIGLAREVATGESGRTTWDQDVQYENGLVAWLGYTGANSGPSVYVYSIKAAEAGQPSIASLDLSPYGFNGGYSVVASTFSQGWFFIDGEGAGDKVPQIYTVNVTGLPATGTAGSSTTASSSTAATTSKVSSSQTTTTTTTSAPVTTSATTGQTTTTNQGPATTTSGSSSAGGTFTTTQALELAAGGAALAIVLLGYFVLQRRTPEPKKPDPPEDDHEYHYHGPGEDGTEAPVTMNVERAEDKGFDPVPPSGQGDSGDEPRTPQEDGELGSGMITGRELAGFKEHEMDEPDEPPRTEEPGPEVSAPPADSQGADQDEKGKKNDCAELKAEFESAKAAYYRELSIPSEDYDQAFADAMLKGWIKDEDRLDEGELDWLQAYMRSTRDKYAACMHVPADTISLEEGFQPVPPNSPPQGVKGAQEDSRVEIG